MSSHDDDPIGPPPFLKSLYSWAKILGVVGTFAAVPVVFFLGESYRPYALVAFPVGVVLCVLLIRLTANEPVRAAKKLIEAQVEQSDARDRVVRGLEKSKTVNSLTIGLLILGIVVLFGLTIYPHVLLALTRATPTVVEFDYRYFVPGQERAILDRGPFLQSLATHLKDEAAIAHTPAQLVIAESKPFHHPTNAVRIKFRVNPEHFDMSGFAFCICAKTPSRFDALIVEYTVLGDVVVELPPSNEGDSVLLMLRVSKKAKHDFPEDVKKLFNEVTIEELQ